MKRKGDFKVKNIYNLTTEQVEGSWAYLNDEPIAKITHADKDYIYGYFKHFEDYNIILEGNPKSMSMEIAGDVDGEINR